MNKIKKIIGIFILICSSLFVVLGAPNCDVAYAETFENPSEYYNVKKQYYADGLGEYCDYTNPPMFSDGDAILLGENERIVVTLGEDTEEIKYSQKLLKIVYTIKINNETTFENAQTSALSNYGIEVPYVNDAETGKAFELTISPKTAQEKNGEVLYGKYTLEISYVYVDENLETKNVYFVSNFYVLNYADYKSSTIYTNLDSTLNGSYYSNFSTANLPYLSYNFKNYNLSIVRVYKGLTSTTNFSYNGNLVVNSYNETGAPTNDANVAIVQKADKLHVVFNNLGAYYLTYQPINPNGSNEPINSFYGEKLILEDIVYVYGFQAYYASDSGLSEFKLANEVEPWIIDYTNLSADVTYLLKNDINNVFTINSEDIAKTNQAPIYFESNVSLMVDSSTNEYTSKYYYFTSNEEFDSSKTLPTAVENFSASPISKAGVYLVELSYVFGDLALGEQKQYFLFKITNDAPKVEIYTLNEGDEKIAINNDEYTYKDVFITKTSLDVFDSKSTLIIYKDVSFNGNYDAGVEVLEDTISTFSETARYKVELKYGNANQKGFISYFVIDKEPISEISISELTKSYGANYYKSGILGGNMITNNAIALSWKEKTSGAVVKAEYKFFPLTYSLVQQNSLTSEMLQTLYNSQQYKHSIPSTYIVNYNGGVIPVDEYGNTYGQNEIYESQALVAGGIYVFYIYDNTGREGTYHYAFIDDSNNTVISVDGNDYNVVINNEITTKDTKVLFGKEKLIKIAVAQNATLDPWFEKYLTEKNSLVYQNQRYLRILNNTKIYYSIDTVENSYNLNEANEYGIDILAKSAEDEYNEHQYIFYVITESIKSISTYGKDTFNYYKQNYTGTFTLTFSTDNSAMRAYYINDGTVKDLLKLQTIEGADQKTNYYEPTTNSMFDILYLTYNVKPSDALQVESVVLKYYAFEKSSLNSTYEFKSEPTSIITLYEDGTLKAGEAVSGNNNTYIYKINLENYSNSLERTKAGKYEIVRTYTEESLINSNDPKVRNIKFIVDRNDLISEPYIDGNGDFNYYVGSGIQLQIINKFGSDYFNSEAGTLHYYDIYYANKLSQTSLVPVVTTNFLPVTVYIPAYKYGYVVNSEGYPKFEIEDSIVKYIDVDQENNEYANFNYFKNYRLSAVIERYENANSVRPIDPPYIFDKNLTNYNFLTSTDGSTITSFNQEGFYRVTISSEAGDKFTFVFQIVYASPEYEVLDDENTPLNSTQTNGVETYYTNKNVVRLSWEDSSSEYLARINRNAIQYTIGGTTYLVDKNTVVTAGENRYYVDIDISRLANNINAYYNNSEIKFTLQFNGKKEDYNNSTYFSKTVVLKVDLEAPTVNISNLIALTGLSASDLRDYSNGFMYNTSKKEGVLKYFSYTVDISNFTEIIKSPNETNGDYYETYYKFFVKDNENTKYENETESNITTSSLTGLTSLWGRGDSFSKILVQANVNKYIEFVEEDYAGNRTVYTIYLTDISANQNETAFTYTSLTNVASLGGATGMEYKVKNLKESIDLYSKRLFNLTNINFIYNEKINNLSWQILKIRNNIYIKSPYSNGKYYNYSSDNQDLLYTLDEITTLSSSGNSQKIEFKNVPKFKNIDLNIYVLNKTLQYYKLSQVYDSNLYEGVVIGLPSSKNSENNVLYAVKLIIKASVKGGEYEATYEIDGSNALMFKEELAELPSLNNILLSYVDYRGGRYLQLQFVENIYAGDYFVYTITDNFGEEYRFIHIYGQTEILEPITSDGFLTQTYTEDGTLVNVSSENIVYKFDTTIYEKTIISVGLNNGQSAKKYFIVKLDGVYVVTDGSDNKLTDFNEYFNFTFNQFNNILSIEMLQTEYNFNNGIFGGRRNFAIEKLFKEDFIVEAEDGYDITSEIINFEIYNEIPSSLNIISKDTAVDVTAILGSNTAYAGTVVINYRYTEQVYDYEVLIMDPSGNITAITDGTEIKEDGTYRLIVNYLGYIKGCSKSFELTIANSERFIYSVVVKNQDNTYRTVNATGSSFMYISGGAEITIATHYIVNADYEIKLNSNLYLSAIVDQTKDPKDGYTKIYNITNLNSPEAGAELITEYYSTQIAISVIPKSTNILKRLIEYGGNAREEISEVLTLKTPAITPYVTTKDEYDAGITIAWSKYNLIPENKVNVEIYYGDVDGIKYDAKVINNYDSTLNSINLITSGAYYLKFVDMAGNVQYFGTYNDIQYFTIKYLSSVIFEIQEQTPINYAIYDEEVVISIPEETISYYDVNSKPKMMVEYNGTEYKKYQKLDTYSWKFTEAGLYKVWFTAKIDENAIYEAPIIFTILSSQESRLGYTYNGYSNYYIKDILKDGISIKKDLTNINSGPMLRIDGEDYLKNLSIHANDIKTGKGSYTFVVGTNNEFGQEFSFTVWINKVIVPIQLSINNGESSTSDIIVSFNTQNVLNAAGDCILKISGFEDLYMSKELLAAGELEDVYNITITKTGNYYIEVTTLSGQLLYSSYVVKAEPLNTISIIIIVVAVIVFGVGVVLFVLLRRKMKIR